MNTSQKENKKQYSNCSNEDYSSSSMDDEESIISDSIREHYTIDYEQESGRQIISIDWQRLEQVETFREIPWEILMIMPSDQKQRYIVCLFNYNKSRYT